MPWSEIVTKDLNSLFQSILFGLKSGKKMPVIVATPDLPGKRTTLHKIAKGLGFRLTNLPSQDAQLVVQFDDQTFSTTQIPIGLKGKKMLNEHCNDISKNKVDRIHREVFGYNTFIDPKIYKGIAVMKSDENAKHDGQKIDCPVAEVESGVIYQILLDNVVDDHLVVDYRIPVMGKKIPLVYCKYKSHALRFTNEVHHSSLHKTDEFISPEEVQLLTAFCQKMGADFCELDVIRHKGDGKIYVIDLNKTPFGPPAGLSKSDSELAVQILTETFRSEFFSAVQSSEFKVR